jgi:hypothetical protein
MAHYAELDDNNIVLRVIVVRTEDTLDENGNESETVANTFLHKCGFTGRFIRTSYNTRQGVHYKSDSDEPSGQLAFRKNYAGIGMTYDPFRDAFILPKPEDPNNPDRYVLDEKTCLWTDTLRKDINIGVTRL